MHKINKLNACEIFCMIYGVKNRVHTYISVYEKQANYATKACNHDLDVNHLRFFFLTQLPNGKSEGKEKACVIRKGEKKIFMHKNLHIKKYNNKQFVWSFFSPEKCETFPKGPQEFHFEYNTDIILVVSRHFFLILPEKQFRGGGRGESTPIFFFSFYSSFFALE